MAGSVIGCTGTRFEPSEPIRVSDAAQSRPVPSIRDENNRGAIYYQVQDMFLSTVYLGRVGYADCLEIQRHVIDLRKRGKVSDTLLLVEHPPVITLGRNAHRENVTASSQFLSSRGVQLHEINRGGDVTYHGPGQLVGYPIVDLRGEFPGKTGPHLGVVDYVRMLEEVLIRTCGDFSILAQRIPGRTGVWTIGGGSIQPKKVAAIGVHVSQGVTSHGFALNVTTDLRDFDWIVPCGISDAAVTSIECEVGSGDDAPPSMADTMNSVVRHFARIFGRQPIWAQSVEQLTSPVE
ncbi:MAG: lipoyl(octanoyl) transferase LipB [Acidobacteriaceae bacterium]